MPRDPWSLLLAFFFFLLSLLLSDVFNTLCARNYSVIRSDIDFSWKRPALMQMAHAHLALSACLPLLLLLSFFSLTHAHSLSFPLNAFSICIFLCSIVPIFFICSLFSPYFLGVFFLQIVLIITFSDGISFAFNLLLSIYHLSFFLSQSQFWCLLSKVTSGEQSLCCIQRERGSSTPACKWNTLSWTICQATDYMIAAPLRHSGEFCFKSQKHDTASPLEQRRHTETKH